MARFIWWAPLAVAALLVAACSDDGTSATSDAGGVRDGTITFSDSRAADASVADVLAGEGGVDAQSGDLGDLGTPCTGAGDCDDKIACTADSCVAQRCVNQIVTGRCLIGGACLNDGDANASNNCLVCAPDDRADDWTKVACVITAAGDGTAGDTDGPAGAARFSRPTGLAVDGSGKIYVADTDNHRIRVVDGGQVSTLAGAGAGLVDGPLADARFNQPAGLAVDGTGRIYVADAGNDRIRVIENGVVSTFAGTIFGYKDGPADQAAFASPLDIAVDAAGTSVYVADSKNHRVRRISSNSVTTIAGTGQNGLLDGAALLARFDGPSGIAFDGASLYVADIANTRIRVINGGQVSTFAGSTDGFKDGPAATAQFNFPGGVLFDSTRNAVFVADLYGQRIRRIKAGQVSTVAGTGVDGHKDGPALGALFQQPAALALGPGGEIYIADQLNHRIRMLTF